MSEQSQYLRFPSFGDSTQAKHWLFTKESLDTRRSAVSSSLLTAEEDALIRFHLFQRVATFHFESHFKSVDSHTKSIALLYLQRYLLVRGLSNIQPDPLLAACISLASKTEERHYQKIAESFHISAEQLSTAELDLISAINYNLVVWTPQDSFQGCLSLINPVCHFSIFFSFYSSVFLRIKINHWILKQFRPELIHS